jgi:hypothetical protein
MDRENLFALFVGAVASLKVDDDGAHCQPAEAQALERMARAVQNRAEQSIPRELALWNLAQVTRVLLSGTDNHDRGRQQDWHMPLPQLVTVFLRVRNEIGDFMRAGTCVPVPDDPYGMEAIPQVRRDGDGRLWTELDPGDEVSEGEDIATVEGGYVFHTDGRPPEPVQR